MTIPMRYCAVALALFALGDIATTAVGLSLGAYEMNPLAFILNPDPLIGGIMLKVLSFPVLLGLVWQGGTYTRPLYLAACFIPTGIAIANNSNLISEMLRATP